MTDGDKLDNDQALEAEMPPIAPCKLPNSVTFVTPRTADN